MCSDKNLTGHHDDEEDQRVQDFQILPEQLDRSDGPLVVRLENSILDVQVEILKKEYDLLKEEIREFNKKSQNCRNWTITLWAGSIVFAVAPDQGNAHSFIILSMIFPLMFWLQDIKWTQLQRIFIFRSKSITDFFCGESYVQSVKAGKVVNFRLDGLRKDTGSELFDDTEYKNFSSFWRVMLFPTKLTFYPVFMVTSIAIHLYFNYSNFGIAHIYSLFPSLPWM